MIPLLSTFTEVKTFHPVHSLARFGTSTVLGEFIATHEGAEIIESVLESLTGVRLPETEARRRSALSPAQIRRSHLVRANFGTGKTITLLALAEMLGALGNESLFQAWRNQFHRFPTVQHQYDMLRQGSGGRPYICLTIDMKEKGAIPFRDVVVQSMYEWVSRRYPHVRLPSEFVSAASQLEAAAQRMPERVAQAIGHYAPGLEVQELLQDLAAWDRSKLELAYQIMEEAAGFPPTRDRLEMRTFYDEVLSEMQTDFAGVAIVLDELHHYFTTSATFNNLRVSVADFDAFAVYVNNTKDATHIPCVMVGAIHENLGSYFRGTGVGEDAFQQAVGRFAEHPLTSALSQVELISGAFVQHRGSAFDQLLATVPDLSAQIRRIQNEFDTVRDWMQCFPLHPAVVTYLPLLSRRLAQNDRTTFHFIDNKVRYWIKEKPAVDHSRFNLVLLPDLYEYFGKEVETREPAVVQAVNNAVSYCAGGTLHRRIMQTLACLHISSSVSTSDSAYRVKNGASKATLRAELNFPVEQDLDNALADLCASGYVHASDLGEYLLVATGGLSHVELERRIESLSTSIDPDGYLVERLRSDWGLRSRTVFANNPSQKGSVSRSFGVHILSEAQLRAFNEMPGSGFTWNLLFVVPSLGSDPAQVQAELQSEFPRLYALGAMVAFPKSMSEIQPDRIRRQESLRKLKNMAATEEQRRTIEDQLVTAEEQLTARLMEFGQPANWMFYSVYGEHRSLKKNLTDILDDVVAKLYHKFPEFRAGNLQSGTVIHGLLDRFLPNPVNFRVDNTAKSRVDSVMGSVGLASAPVADPSCYSLTVPADERSHPRSVAVWRELEGMDLSADRPLEQLHQVLARPPYGLSIPIIELYMGVYLRLKGISVYNKKTLSYVQDLQTNTVRDIVSRKDESYRLEPPSNTSASDLSQLQAVWAPIAQAVGSQGYLSTVDPTATDSQRVKALVQDVRAFCELVQSRLLAPKRVLGAPAEADEELAAELQSAVANPDLPPNQILQSVAGIPAHAVDQLRQRVDAAGVSLRDLAEKWTAIEQVPTPDPDAYPDLSRVHSDIKAGVAKADLSDVTTIKALLQMFHQFQPLFLAHYSAEHDSLHESREKFGETILHSPLLAFVRPLSRINVPPKAARFGRGAQVEAEVLSERKSACSVRGSAPLLKAGTYACPHCPGGSYRLGTAQALTQGLVSRESRLQDDLSQGVRQFRSWLQKLEDPDHVKTLGLPCTLGDFLLEHDGEGYLTLSRLLRSLQRLTTDGDDPQARGLLEQLIPGLNRYLRLIPDDVSGPRRLRRTLDEVVALAEQTLASQGLEVITLTPDTAAERCRVILQAIEQALVAEPGDILEIVLRRKNIG